MFVGQQRRQIAVGGQYPVACTQRGVDAQGQGVDEHAQCPVSALAALQAPHQHRAEHHIAAVGQHAQHPCPGQVHQACSADTQAPGLAAHVNGHGSVQRHHRVLDSAAVALHVGIPQRQGRLAHIVEHGVEEGFMGLLIDQAGLGHVVAVRHGGRQGLPLAEQQRPHLVGDHVHGGVVQGQVVEQQHRDHLMIVWVQGVVQAGQGRLGQVQAVVARVEAGMQLLDAGHAGLVGQVRHFAHAQLSLAPHHLYRLRQPLAEHGGA